MAILVIYKYISIAYSGLQYPFKRIQTSRKGRAASEDMAGISAFWTVRRGG